jgi:LuxR family maltose regulon positive regulatory protein
MALALGRNREGADQLIVSGRHRFIADYLSEDVLDHLPEEIQRFLLQTSVLDRLCGSLCDQVTGRNDGQEVLRTLERANLFLVPLDDNRDWFRYHRLFGDFLQAELSRRYPDEVAHIHRRAARWYSDHDLPEPAVRHSVASEDADLVLQILKRYFYAKLLAGEFTAVKRWLDLLPADWFSIPELGLARVALLLNTGAVDSGARLLNEIEQRLLLRSVEESRSERAQVSAIRCFVACFQNDLARAETSANQALRDLPDEDHVFRPGIYGALGDTYSRHGLWKQAHASYLKVLDFPSSPGFRVESVHLFGALADLHLRQGHLRQASAYWRKALDAIQDHSRWGVDPLPVIGWVYIRMGEVLYEWNDLTDAWSHLSSGLKRAELSGDVRALISGYLFASRVKLTEGDVEAASHYLERAHPLVEAAHFHDWTSRFERYQIELWLAQNRLRAAVSWTDEMLANDPLQIRPEPELARLAIARVLIHKGDAASIRQAVTLLSSLRRTSGDEGRMGVQIEALALESLACWRRGEQANALTALERALRLAEAEGYIRLFADLGLPMVRLLQFAHARDVMPGYTAKLLSACGAGRESLRSAVSDIPEPLTDREREILGLVAAGLTNSEIADRLSISPQTVKKHTGNIYGKLAVRGRTEAVARARALDLLS